MHSRTANCIVLVSLAWSITSAALVCSGSLAFRFQKNMDVNDADLDGFVTGREIFKDFTNNYDVNKDGCCNRKEWVDRWTQFFHFSPEYANARYDDGLGNDSLPCPIAIAPFNTQPIKIPDLAFLNSNVETLVQMCEGNKQLYYSNCDCLTLKDSCLHAPLFVSMSACDKFRPDSVTG